MFPYKSCAFFIISMALLSCGGSGSSATASSGDTTTPNSVSVDQTEIINDVVIEDGQTLTDEPALDSDENWSDADGSIENNETNIQANDNETSINSALAMDSDANWPPQLNDQEVEIVPIENSTDTNREPPTDTDANWVAPKS